MDRNLEWFRSPLSAHGAFLDQASLGSLKTEKLEG